MNSSVHTTGISLQGIYKVAIVDKDGNEVWRQPEWGKNLILNNGMDHVSVKYFANLMLNAIAGTGTRVNSITSSTSNASVINGTLTLDPQPGGIQNFDAEVWGGWTGCLSAGDVIKFADSTEVNVGTASAAGAIVLPTNATVSTQSFTIWKTSQTKLQTELRRAGTTVGTSSYLDGYNGTTLNYPVTGAVYHYRTFDFGEEGGGTVNYNEVGVGWSGIAQSTTVFSRICLPAPVTLVNTQRLRLVYGMIIQFQPTSSVYMTDLPVAGWPVAPSTNTNVTQSLQILHSSVFGAYIFAGGSTNTIDNDGPYEPASSGNDCYIWLSAESKSLYSTITASLSNVDRSLSGSYVGTTKSPYVSGSYSQHKYGMFGLNDCNTNRLMECGTGGSTGFPQYYTPDYEACAFAVRFDQPQTKTTTQTLTLGFRWSWSRVLQ